MSFHINYIIIEIYSSARSNHYSVLNVKQNCSPKEIKEAFIRLSKEVCEFFCTTFMCRANRHLNFLVSS